MDLGLYRTKGYTPWIIYYIFRTIHIKMLTEEDALLTDYLRLQFEDYRPKTTDYRLQTVDLWLSLR